MVNINLGCHHLWMPKSFALISQKVLVEDKPFSRPNCGKAGGNGARWSERSFCSVQLTVTWEAVAGGFDFILQVAAGDLIHT